MSKSMWNLTDDGSTPVSDTEKRMFSTDVLFWVKGEIAPRWGYVNFHNMTWIDDKTREVFSPIAVKYFAYIDNPYK